MNARINRYKNILVGTDFSDHSKAAIEWAIELAIENDATVTLVHAIEVHAGTMLPLTIQEQVARKLNDLETVMKKRNVEVYTSSDVGRSWDVINEAARKYKADLVVLGTRGHTRLPRLILGSTANRVIRLSRVPVLTIHPDDSPSHPAIRRILVATDFSEESALATSAAVRLLRSSSYNDCRLLLVHANHTPIAYEAYSLGTVITEQIAANEKQARCNLEKIAAPFRDEIFAVEIFALEGYPVTVIREIAEAQQVDLIALGTHGRSGASRLFLGSIAERVVEYSHCPVLTVRKPGAVEPMQLSA